MSNDQREVQRKMRIFQYADEIGSVVKVCRFLVLAVQVFIVGAKISKN